MDEKSKVADPQLLMEIMDLREQIEESTSASEVKELIRENRQAIDEVKAQLSAAYKARDLQKMVEGTNRLQYLSKVDFEAREKLDELDDDDHDHESSSGHKQSSSG